MLALAVGGDTEYGKTLALVGGAGDQTTPLTEKLNDLAGGWVGGQVGAQEVREHQRAMLRQDKCGCGMLHAAAGILDAPSNSGVAKQ